MGVKRMGLRPLTNLGDTKLRRNYVKILQKASTDTVLKAWLSTTCLSAPQLSWICDTGNECLPSYHPMT